MPRRRRTPRSRRATARGRAVAAALRRTADELSELDAAELSEHVDYYQRAHAQLQRALSDIDHA